MSAIRRWIFVGHRAGFFLVFMSCLIGPSSFAFAQTPEIDPFPQPPEITNQPMSQVVIAGANVTFSVGAYSETAPTYQWRFNGTNLPGADERTLRINNVQPSHAGTYSVRVSNGTGFADSSNATLTVLVPPRITAQPQSRTAPLCSMVVFNVNATGTPPPRYQWQFNGNPIPKATNANLVLNNVSRTNEGDYHVVVSNSAGMAVSSNASLQVFSSGGQIGPSAWRVPLGTMGSQMLDSPGSNPPPPTSTPCGAVTQNARWLQLVPEEDGTFVIDTLGSEFDTILAIFTGENLFNLTYVTCNDDGFPEGPWSEVRFLATHCQNYFVAVDGVQGSLGNVRVNWKLGKPPDITRQPTNQTVPEGGEVSFIVEVMGVPAPNFQWRFNGQDMPDATNSIWTLVNAQPTNAGNYSVVAHNFIGAETSREARLVIEAMIRLSPLGLAPDGFHFRLQGPPGTYTIERSEHLPDWFTLTTVSTSSGMTEVVDPDAFIFSQRFYRAIKVP